ncbi:MAG TPA: DUF4235 domain-containing protein [Solirubrobacteraceae bacterium]|nr:DUF4235 domain-containing protein [Solirubrobacteraceae bacterium]
MGVLYKPFSILARLLAKRMGQAAVSDLWSRVGDSDGPPPANAGRRPLGSVFATAAVQAAILAGVGAVVDQLAARAFHQIFGAWPGKPVPELAADDAPAAAA